MKIQPLLSLVVLLATARSFAEAPDFTLEAYRGNKKLPLVGVVIKAPAKHHFNVKAPMSAKTVASSIDLAPTTTTDHEIRFEVENPSVPAQDSIEVVAYLCDDAKTFCVKKSGTVAIASARNPNLNKIVSDVELPNARENARPNANDPQKRSLAPQAVKAPPKEAKVATSGARPGVSPLSGRPHKDEHGFWDNAPDAAVAEAKKLNKPILIDFYGIWCPPCNMFNELVFPTAKFKTEAKNYVLLKMDADQTASWELKSRYKIGGYPTIVFAKPNLEEIDRAVGFFPRDEFASRMKQAYTNRDLKLEDRVMRDKARYLDGLQTLVEVRLEQRDAKEALRFAQEGLKSSPEDHFFKLVETALLGKDDPKIFKRSETTAFLKSIWENRAKATAAELLRFVELLTSDTELFTGEQVLWAADVLDHLKSRANPATLQIDGQEITVPDLDALRIDVFEGAKKPELAKQAVKDTIDSYRKLMKINNNENSRGLNLELAYYLGKDGQIQAATDIYEGFIKKYPKEFTYYYAAARHYQDNVKDLKRARECADLAVQYSYGDNQLRSMARLLGIRNAQGEGTAGIEQARAILAKVPSYEGLSVRTGRYVSALEKEIDKASGKGGKK